jgi:hypothetical protein
MPDIEAARIVYGTPGKSASTFKLEEWLDTHCRDWRYESGPLERGTLRYVHTVVSAVFKDPVKKDKLSNLVTQQVRRWGFVRAKHSTDNIVEMSIDEYADGPLGRLMSPIVAGIKADIEMRNEAQKQRRADERRARMEKFAEVLAAVKQRAVDWKLKAAMEKLRHNVDEAQGLVDAALEQESKRRRVEEDR